MADYKDQSPPVSSVNDPSDHPVDNLPEVTIPTWGLELGSTWDQSMGNAKLKEVSRTPAGNEQGPYEKRNIQAKGALDTYNKVKGPWSK